MKNGILAGVTLFIGALLIGPDASAYQSAAQKHSKCEAAGELAQAFYGTSTEELRRRAAELDADVKNKKITKKLAEATKYIFFMGKTAKSERAAYMDAWAWCMDQK